ncbi:MAG: hypothetical protein OXC30_00940 [Alphaproteobacteria bacterium]|nr:hypothetical protein [Alphaproteobacteria bacterium]
MLLFLLVLVFNAAQCGERREQELLSEKGRAPTLFSKQVAVVDPDALKETEAGLASLKICDAATRFFEVSPTPDGEALKAEKWCAHLKFTKVVAVAELKTLWEKHPRSHLAQNQWQTMLDCFEARLEQCCADRVEVNRNILLSHLLRVMIQDKQYNFIPPDEERSQPVSIQPHDLTIYTFFKNSDGSGVTDLFQEDVPHDIAAWNTKRLKYRATLDLVYLFSLDHMKRVIFVDARPTKQDRVFAARKSEIFMHVDTSIKSYEALVNSLVAQMIVSPLKELLPSFPSLEEIQVALEGVKDDDREYLLCAYLLAFLRPHYYNPHGYNPDETHLQLEHCWEFWSCACKWGAEVALCDKHPQLCFQDGYAHHDLHQYETKDMEKILKMALENISQDMYSGDVIIQHRYGFPILKAAHALNFLWMKAKFTPLSFNMDEGQEV